MGTTINGVTGTNVQSAMTGTVTIKNSNDPRAWLGTVCIFRKNCASVPEERSAIPLQTEQSSAGLLVTVVYSTIPARKFKTICLGCHSA